ncbi:MAG: hypothetical protein OXC48_08915, partial [Endozoicomonadaceae bacterium]|nr:hypothetical protein [Endozoicomonadaceae bacterium]
PLSLLDEIPLKLLNTRVLIRDFTPAVDYFDVEQYLLQKVPRFIDIIRGQPHLKIKNIDHFNTIWNFLFKHSSIIDCDTALILTFARIRKNPLNLNLFQDFLTCKYSAQKAFLIDDLPRSQQMEIMQPYLLSLWGHFNLLNGGGLVTNSFREGVVRSLEAASLNIGEIAMVVIPNHAALIIKLISNGYMGYFPIGDNVLLRFGRADQMEKLLFNCISADMRYICYLLRFKI